MASVLSGPGLMQGFAEARKAMLLCMGPKTILAYLPVRLSFWVSVVQMSDFT